VRVVAAGPSSFSVVAPGGLRAVTPGQAAVLYDGERVVGGGWIVRAADEALRERESRREPSADAMR
jgi:tRNA-specific 2-thiouridylase